MLWCSNCFIWSSVLISFWDIHRWFLRSWLPTWFLEVKNKNHRLMSWKFSNSTTKGPERYQLVSSELTLSRFSTLLYYFYCLFSRCDCLSAAFNGRLTSKNILIIDNLHKLFNCYHEILILEKHWKYQTFLKNIHLWPIYFYNKLKMHYSYFLIVF